MLGLEIFILSLRQVTSNIAMAARISWWLVLAIILAVWLAIAGINEGGDSVSAVSTLTFIVIFIFVIWAFSLISIVWHRYILLAENPTGIVPFRSEFKVWTFFRKATEISLLLILSVFTATLIFGIFVPPDAMSAAVAFGLATGIITTMLFFRMSLVLSSVSLNKSMTLREAWVLTKGFNGPVFVLVISTVVFNFGMNSLIEVAFGLGPEFRVLKNSETGMIFADGVSNRPLYIFLTGLLQWFIFMLYISILTTLYGHIVEKRDVF